MINEQSYRYLTGEEMKGFGDESAPIDVTRDERCDVNTGNEKHWFISFYNKWVLCWMSENWRRYTCDSFY